MTYRILKKGNKEKSKRNKKIRKIMNDYKNNQIEKEKLKNE